MAGQALRSLGCGNLYDIQPDLMVPAMTEGPPSAGLRVRQSLPAYGGTQVHHALYLPVDWKAGRRYPLLVEYAGNGGYEDADGDRCTGTVDGSALGYGISAGRGYLWLCLPFVDAARGENALTWWGDVRRTVEYCREAVDTTCRLYGGDRRRVFLMGFSRGAIACNYIGLHDDSIARLWRGFVAHSHYDGVRTWPYPESEREFALERLHRLKGRPVFISQECSVDNIRAYLASTGVRGRFAFAAPPFRNHTDTWVLRNVAERGQLRRWMKEMAG